jgi:putative holliday junction resolvase
MRTLAIDLGTRRVGLALSDEGGRFATPLEVVFITAPQQAIDRIMQVVAKEGVERILVGLPLNMDDSIGSSARNTLDWAHQLKQLTGKPIVFVDERLSSFSAEQNLNDRKRAGEKITKKRRKEKLDAIVAAELLQAFLDGRLPALSDDQLAI